MFKKPLYGRPVAGGLPAALTTGKWAIQRILDHVFLIYSSLKLTTQVYRDIKAKS